MQKIWKKLASWNNNYVSYYWLLLFMFYFLLRYSLYHDLLRDLSPCRNSYVKLLSFFVSNFYLFFIAPRRCSRNKTWHNDLSSVEHPLSNIYLLVIIFYFYLFLLHQGDVHITKRDTMTYWAFNTLNISLLAIIIFLAVVKMFINIAE